MVFDAAAEFDRQVGTLLALGYAALAGLSADGFTDLLRPLRPVAVAYGGEPPTPDRVPFVVVVPAQLVPAAAAVPLTALSGRPGAVSRHLPDLDRFLPTDLAPLPAGGPYLALDVQRGAEFRDLPPDDALPALLDRGRSPLTVEEGVAFITHFPASLARNHCFSLPGSRCGDRRVPALWISTGAPTLGWCWAGNPHSWLGVASAAARAAADGAPAVADR